MSSIQFEQLKAASSGECYICFHDWEAGDLVLHHDDPNSHTFHRMCALEWISTRLNQNFDPKCSVCNAKVTHVNGLPVKTYMRDLENIRRGIKVLSAARENSKELKELLRKGEIDIDSLELAIEEETRYLNSEDESLSKQAFLNIEELLNTDWGSGQCYEVLRRSPYFGFRLVHKAEKNSDDLRLVLIGHPIDLKYRELAVEKLLVHLSSDDWKMQRRALVNIALLIEEGGMSKEFLSRTCQSSHPCIHGLTLLELKRHINGLIILGDVEANTSVSEEQVRLKNLSNIDNKYRKLAISKALGLLDSDSWEVCKRSMDWVYMLLISKEEDLDDEFLNGVCESKNPHINGLVLRDFVKNYWNIKIVGEAESNHPERVNAILAQHSQEIDERYYELAIGKAFSNLNSRDWRVCHNALSILISLVRSGQVSEVVLDMKCHNERSYIHGVPLRELSMRCDTICFLRAADENDNREMKALFQSGISPDAKTIEHALKWGMYYADSEDLVTSQKALRNIVLLLSNCAVSDECKGLTLESEREYINGVVLRDLPGEIYGIEVVMAAEKNDDYQLSSKLWGASGTLSISHRKVALEKAIGHLDSPQVVKCENALRNIVELLDSQEVSAELHDEILGTLLTKDFSRRKDAKELLSTIFTNLTWTASLSKEERALAVFQAIKDNELDRAKSLLQHGEISSVDWNKAFVISAELRHVESMRHFSQNGMVENEYRGQAIVSLAMGQDTSSVIEEFLSERSPNAEAQTTISPYYRGRAVCQAARFGRFENAEMIMRDGEIEGAFYLRAIQLSINNGDVLTLETLTAELFWKVLE